MPARPKPASDHQMKDWLTSQFDGFQDHLHNITLTLSYHWNRVAVVLSYLNPFTYIALGLNVVHRLCVSPHTHRSILGSVILGFIFALSFLLSLIAYITFYWAYIPHVGFSLPVWLQYGEARTPYATIDLASLSPGITIDQAYDVSLHLTVPTNDRNMNMGNFMIHLSMATTAPDGTVLHQSSRHASLMYEPRFARLLHAFKYLRTFFLLSAPPSVQHLKVPLLEHRVIHPNSLGKRTKIGQVRIDVGRKDIYQSPELLLQNRGWGELQVYRAVLVFDAHLDGLRWALYYHPYISFCLFSAMFFVAQLTTVFCTWGIVLYRDSRSKSKASRPSIKHEPLFDLPPDALNEDRSVKPEVRSQGLPEGEDSSGSESDQRYLDDSEDHDFDSLLGSPPKIKIETDDEGVLVGTDDALRTDQSTSTSPQRIIRRKFTKSSSHD